jgi:hypothetical protein
MCTSSSRQILLSLCAVTAFLCLTARPVGAQTFGVRVGASADPDQFVIGGHYETKPLVDRISFRPNLELGLGNGLTVTSFNFELAYTFPNTKPWNFYAGGGPALVVIDSNRDNQAGGGFNILFGLQSHEGLFGEIKAGLLDSPDFKVLIGYTFHR